VTKLKVLLEPLLVEIVGGRKKKFDPNIFQDDSRKRF
jgi:hypothetical protein